MPSLAELRKKIKGISSTRQITKAMKMVAGARFSRAARQMNDALHYQAEIEKLLFDFLSIAGPLHGRFASLCRSMRSSMPADASSSREIGLIVVAADKGLCGDFNNSIIREADGFLKKNSGRVAALIAIGKKAVEHYRNTQVSRKIEHAQFFNRFDYTIADTIGNEALKICFEKNISEYTVIHSHFKSMIRQQLIVTKFLPVETAQPFSRDSLVRSTTIEPAEEEAVLQALLPMYVKAKMYGILRDSFTAELAARMRAMDNATRNAGSLIDTITLEMNKTRQALITRELSEIIATNEVVR